MGWGSDAGATLGQSVPVGSLRCGRSWPSFSELFDQNSSFQKVSRQHLLIKKTEMKKHLFVSFLRWERCCVPGSGCCGSGVDLEGCWG